MMCARADDAAGRGTGGGLTKTDAFQRAQANASHAAEVKDLQTKIAMLTDEKKKSEDTLRHHAQELKQQLIIMQTKLDRAVEIDKAKDEKLAQQDAAHKEKVEEYKKMEHALQLKFQDAQAKIESEHKQVKAHEAEHAKQRDVIMRLEAKNASLIQELDAARAQCVQWQREADVAKANAEQARADAEAAKEERMKEEKHRHVAENTTADSRRKAEEATAFAAEQRELRKLAEQSLDVRENELKDLKHKAQMMEKDYKEMLSNERAQRAELEENYETLKQDSVNLYNAYTSCNQQIEEYRIALEREAQDAAALHAALAKQKEDAARDALRTRSTRVVAPPAGFLGSSSFGGGTGSPGFNKSPTGRGNGSGVRIGEADDLRSPPSFHD